MNFLHFLWLLYSFAHMYTKSCKNDILLHIIKLSTWLFYRELWSIPYVQRRKDNLIVNALPSTWLFWVAKIKEIHNNLILAPPWNDHLLCSKGCTYELQTSWVFFTYHPNLIVPEKIFFSNFFQLLWENWLQMTKTKKFLTSNPYQITKKISF